MPTIKTIADVTRVHAAARPHQVAMVFKGRKTTYAELDLAASRVANALLDEGLAPQGRVAILDKNTDEFFEILYGAIKAGQVLVPVNWRLAPPEIAQIIDDAQAKILFVGPAYFDLIDKLRPTLKTVAKVIALGGDHPGLESYAAWRDGQPGTDPMCPVKAEDVVIQLYTSGTTGLPKGVMLTHANLVVNAHTNFHMWGGWTERETILVNMPLFHIAGSGVGMITFFLGARAVIMPDVDPGEILDLIQNERITRLFFVPAIILMLAQHPKTPKTDLTSLKTLLYGASPIPSELLVQALKIFSGTEFIQVYGMTETTGAVTALPGADHVPGSKRILSCGKVYPGSSLRIIDTEGKEAKTGEVGQILVHSPQNMLGYWAKPEETAKTLREGWVYTGDAGYLDEEGYLYIHDRVKDMIISGGENIYPAEVESALYGHPAIADVAAIGVPSEKWGEEVKAVVVLKPGAKASEAEIIAFARERIAGYKLPKSVAFVDNLPRNPSGKLLKRLIREPYWQGKTRRVN